MSIIGDDNREIITSFEFPYSTVTAIDFLTTNNVNGEDRIYYSQGSGITVAPNHVLTAAHNAFNRNPDSYERDSLKMGIRATTSENENELETRLLIKSYDSYLKLRQPGSDANVTNVNYLAGYDQISDPKNDIALFTTGDAPIAAKDAIGLIAFVDPATAQGLSIKTAGYPGDNVENLGSTEDIGRDLVRAPAGDNSTGTIAHSLSDGRIYYSENIDTHTGQSGSGLWHTIDQDPLVLGVHTTSGANNNNFNLNSGRLITKDIYDKIVAQIQEDSGTDNADELPENTIVGSENGNEIVGSYRREHIIGNAGNDTINGGDADDRLEGGLGNDILDGEEGEDLAIFNESYADENGIQNYDIVTNNSSITITHKNGGIDGVDTLKNIEFGIFKGEEQPLGGTNGAIANSIESATTRIIPLPLQDGVEKTEVVEVAGDTYNLHSYKLPTKASVSLTAPVDMLDGDIDYTLDISPYDPNSEYNIVYIIDTSQSMSGGKLQAVKNAYTDLINSHIDSGLADNGNFGVVEFSTNATSYSNLTPEEAISTINGLTTDTNPGTVYDGGLSDGLNFLGESSSSIDALLDANNIAYFVSGDISNKVTRSCFFGFCTTQNDYNSYFDEAERLKDYAEVRAFGFDDASPLQIDDVDSDDGTMLSSASGLSTELLKSGLRGEVESVNILLDGEVIDTLTPDQFTNNPAGLTYEGSVDELDVSVDGENTITAEVVFTPESNIDTTTVEHTVTAGGGRVVDQNGNPIDELNNEDVDPFERTRNGSDGDDDITLGFVDKGANGGAGGDYIVGNRRDNILDGGAGDDTIFGHEGNDTIITGTGINKVDGGEDIDTVLYNDVSYQGNSNLSFEMVGNTLVYSNSANYPDADYLSDVEYLQFSDVRLDASTLEITPTIAELSDVGVIEGETASFTFNLDYPASTDIVFDYTTEDLDAVAPEDYTATSGQITIPAGDTTATIDIPTIEDTVYDEGTETFSLNLTNLTGATFNNNDTELSLTAFVEDRDEPLTLIGTNQDDVLTGGSENDSLKGGNGNDYLYANAGNDTLRGDAGDDLLDGGEGDDSLFGNTGNDTVIGGDGYDRIVEISNGNFVLSDTQLNANGIDSIDGIEIANLTGGNANNSINASAVTAIDTIIKSQAGNDTIRGGAVSDIIDAGADDDIVLAYGGNDNIKGGTGNDSLNGGFGDDTIVASAGDDTIVGGSGIDLLIESGDSDFTLTDSSLIGNGTDSIRAIQQVNLTGGNSSNNIDASATTTINRTILIGGAGDDTISGGAKQDVLYGDDGNDSLTGGDLRDVLYGGTGNDVLMGMSGNDVLRGEAGDDTMIGGEGTDVFTGGAGADIFAVEVTTAGRDVILDFEDGVDRILLGSGLSFDDLRIVGNAEGTVSAIRLESNEQLLTVVKNISYTDLTIADFDLT